MDVECWLGRITNATSGLMQFRSYGRVEMAQDVLQLLPLVLETIYLRAAEACASVWLSERIWIQAKASHVLIDSLSCSG